MLTGGIAPLGLAGLPVADPKGLAVTVAGIAEMILMLCCPSRIARGKT